MTTSEAWGALLGVAMFIVALVTVGWLLTR